MDAGTAIADTLFGIDGTSPAGRLPFSIAQNETDLPDELDMSLTAPPHGRYQSRMAPNISPSAPTFSLLWV